MYLELKLSVLRDSFKSDGSLYNDPTLASVYGFGKHVCPGRHFVDAMLCIFAVYVLSVFDIVTGRGGPFECTYSGGLTRLVRRVEG
jgi:hypothetical protein